MKEKLSRSDTEETRKDFARFLESGNKKFSFTTGDTPENRLKFIHNVIFPGRKKYRFYLRDIIARIAYFIDFAPAKVLIYRMIGMKIGYGVFISPLVLIDPHFPELVEIEDYAVIGYGARIFCHELSGMKYTAGRVKIGRAAVIGAFSSIRAGVEIGESVTVPWLANIYKDFPGKCHDENA